MAGEEANTRKEDEEKKGKKKGRENERELIQFHVVKIIPCRLYIHHIYLYT